jgi:diguanylate cyclase (GGDEF)-like protein
MHPALSFAAIFALATGQGPARRLLRIVLPAALILIGLSGLAALGGHRLGLVGIAVGAGLFALATVMIVTATITWSAWQLNAESIERRRVQGEIQLHALRDPLTGLANRGFFFDQLARRAALAGRRTSVPFAVCSLELDGFARLVEQFGRDAGNRILVKVAEVVRECVRASDLVARLDGDHFGILLEEIADAKDVNLLAQRIVSSVPRALAEIADAPISVSIGIVLKTSGHDLPGDMLREADAALTLAKKRGPGRFELTAFAE